MCQKRLIIRLLECINRNISFPQQLICVLIRCVRLIKLSDDEQLLRPIRIHIQKPRIAQPAFIFIQHPQVPDRASELALLLRGERRNPAFQRRWLLYLLDLRGRF